MGPKHWGVGSLTKHTDTKCACISVRAHVARQGTGGDSLMCLAGLPTDEATGRPSNQTGPHRSYIKRHSPFHHLGRLGRRFVSCPRSRTTRCAPRPKTGASSRPPSLTPPCLRSKLPRPRPICRGASETGPTTKRCCSMPAASATKGRARWWGRRRRRAPATSCSASTGNLA